MSPTVPESFSSQSPSVFLFWIVAPQPFQRRRQGLHDDTAIDMARAQREDIAIIVTLFLQDRGHAVVGQRPVVPGLFGHIEAVVLLAHFHPDADRLLRRL